jgi:7-cyano-7-deazaguanine reductase
MHTKQKPRRARASSAAGLSWLSASHTPVPDKPDASTLEAFPNTHPGRPYWITLDCPEFTSLCPITGQPDFGHLTISYVPNTSCLESKSLKLYLYSYRNHGSFHEEVVNRILDDLVSVIRPRRAVITGQFRPRGGIAISVKASYPHASIREKFGSP